MQVDADTANILAAVAAVAAASIGAVAAIARAVVASVRTTTATLGVEVKNLAGAVVDLRDEFREGSRVQVEHAKALAVLTNQRVPRARRTKG